MKYREFVCSGAGRSRCSIFRGGNKFSARVYASNFDNENMTKEVEYVPH
ncbi:hypothetical protein [Clostridium magnum]|nr:hypothetical protein [Clostridium magnum]